MRRYEAAFSSALSLTDIDVVSWLCTQVDSGILQQVSSYGRPPACDYFRAMRDC